MINTLHIKQLTLEYELEGRPGKCPITEFVIDGQPLSSMLGIDRDMGSSECDMDRVTKKINPALTERMISELAARTKPFNQFGTDRTVLYRCHCGCDYCGVISCRISEGEDTIEWNDITFEDDTGPIFNGEDHGYPELKPISRLVFNKTDYLSEITHFDQDCA